jgi:pyruvate-formate lyase-activating enzyme
MTDQCEQIVIYGASAYGLTFLRQVEERYGPVAAFADSSPYKQGSLCGGREILSLSECQYLYPDCRYYIGAGFSAFEPIQANLTKANIGQERIINAKGGLVRKRSCRWLENYCIITNDACGCCCEQPPLIFAMETVDEESFMAFLQVRAAAAAGLNDRREQGTACENCPRIIEDDFLEHKSDVVSLSLAAGGICNLNCYNCTQAEERQALRGENVSACSRRNLDFLRIVKKHMDLADDLQIDIANGEITVNPLCDEILEKCRGSHVTVFTNAVQYNGKLAEMLDTGYFNLFVDLSAGMPAAYARIKGADVFAQAAENIVSYAQHGPVRLKYIFFEGINDNKAEVDAFIELVAKTGHIAEVAVSSDMTIVNQDVKQSTLDLIVYFLRQLRLRRIPCGLIEPAFTADDSRRIKNLFLKG